MKYQIPLEWIVSYNMRGDLETPKIGEYGNTKTPNQLSVWDRFTFKHEREYSTFKIIGKATNFLAFICKPIRSRDFRYGWWRTKFWGVSDRYDCWKLQ